MDGLAKLAVNTNNLINDIDVLESALLKLKQQIPDDTDLNDKAVKALGMLPAIKQSLFKIENRSINLFLKKNGALD